MADHQASSMHKCRVATTLSSARFELAIQVMPVSSYLNASKLRRTPRLLPGISNIGWRLSSLQVGMVERSVCSMFGANGSLGACANCRRTTEYMPSKVVSLVGLDQAGEQSSVYIVDTILHERGCSPGRHRNRKLNELSSSTRLYVEESSAAGLVWNRKPGLPLQFDLLDLLVPIARCPFMNEASISRCPLTSRLVRLLGQAALPAVGYRSSESTVRHPPLKLHRSTS